MFHFAALPSLPSGSDRHTCTGTPKYTDRLLSGSGTNGHRPVAYASRQGWEIGETYQDTISGAKASRPGLNRLMAGAMARKFQCLLVWKLDRFGRSLVDCLNNIKTLEDHGIRFIAVTQGSRY